MVDEENLHFMPDSKVVCFKWRFLWNTVLSFQWVPLLSQKLFSSGCCIPPVCHLHLTCLHLLWKLARSLPQTGTVWEGYPPESWGSCGWTGCRVAGEKLRREMALTKRWSNLPEQADSLFAFFGCALLSVSGFACAPWQTKQYETVWIAKHHL